MLLNQAFRDGVMNGKTIRCGEEGSVISSDMAEASVYDVISDIYMHEFVSNEWQILEPPTQFYTLAEILRLAKDDKGTFGRKNAPKTYSGLPVVMYYYDSNQRLRISGSMSDINVAFTADDATADDWYFT